MESVVHPRRFFWILLATAAVQAAYFFPQLPAEVASRFGSDGEVLQTMSRSGFMALHLGITGVVAALLAGFPMEHVPDAFIRIPRKDYWLNAKNREESIRLLQDQIFVLCNATLMLLTMIFHYVLQANLLETPHLDASFTWVPLGIYISYTLLWTLRLVKRFQVPKERPAT